MTVYLVMEDDWESSVVLHASLDKAWADRVAAELDASYAVRRAARPGLSICTVRVEEHELEGGQA